MSRPPAQPPRPSGPTPPPRPTPTPPPKPPPRPTGPRSDAEELYSVIGLAQRWHCSRDLIYDLIAKGKLRTVQLGNGRAKTRIPASAAAEFVAKRGQAA